MVCYTTNDRGAGLSFGRIKKINAKTDVRPRWNPATRQYDGTTTYTEYTIRVAITDVAGNPEYETRWDPEYPNPEAYNGSGKGKHVLTDKQRQSGLIQYSAGKFLVL